MTPVIKKNLVRYSETIFPDAQTKQYNQLNWPYIGIIIKDGEFRGGSTFEPIFV